jgi:hypothetical protein
VRTNQLSEAGATLKSILAVGWLVTEWRIGNCSCGYLSKQLEGFSFYKKDIDWKILEGSV